jgi:hypothetical protein
MSSSFLRGEFSSSMGGRWHSSSIWSKVRSLLANKMLCNTQHVCTTVDTNSSFRLHFPPIFLNLVFRMPNPLSTLMRVDECFLLNQTSSFVKGVPMGPSCKVLCTSSKEDTPSQPRCRVETAVLLAMSWGHHGTPPLGKVSMRAESGERRTQFAI